MCDQARVTAVPTEGAHRLWKRISEWAALGSPVFVSAFSEYRDRVLTS